MTVQAVCDISGDGRYVLYLSDTRLDPFDSDWTTDLFIHDRTSRTTQYVGHVNSDIGEQTQCGSINADGRYIAFISSAKDLVPNDTNDYGDVFVVDQQTGAITRASVDSNGVQANGSSYSMFLSADGRYVLFDSSARSLSPGGVAGASREVYLRDLQSGTTTLVSQAKNGARASDRTYANAGSISPDGHVIVFSSNSAIFVPGDRNDTIDIFSAER
jgi:Tol biopolymer transport system component